MVRNLGISLFLFFMSCSVYAASDIIEFKAPPKNLSEVSLIDARSRDAWLGGRLPNSIYLDWDHFSQPGAGSRGSLRKNPQLIADDLALIGIHKDQPIYIYGRGIKGRADEGRLAWIFYWLGFKKIYISDFNTAKIWSDKALEKGPYFPKSTKPWKVDLRSTDILSLADYKKMRKERKPLILIDLRGHGQKEKLPGIYTPHDLALHWTLFLTHPQIAKSSIENLLKSRSFDKSSTPIIPISFAGLRSAYIYLILKSWGYESYFIPDGFSMEL